MDNTNISLHPLNTLRIYFQQRQPNPDATFWKRFWGSSLSRTLLRQAKAAEVRQVVMYPVQAGFLQGYSIVYASTEIVPPSLPVCIEITDEPDKVKAFIIDNGHLLHSAFLVLENKQAYRAVVS